MNDDIAEKRGGRGDTVYKQWSGAGDEEIKYGTIFFIDTYSEVYSKVLRIQKITFHTFLLHMNFQMTKANPRQKNLRSWMNPDVYQSKYDHFLDIDPAAYMEKVA